jgi:hypothetical protein
MVLNLNNGFEKGTFYFSGYLRGLSLCNLRKPFDDGPLARGNDDYGA